MRFCEICGARFRGEATRCPLDGGALVEARTGLRHLETLYLIEPPMTRSRLLELVPARELGGHRRTVTLALLCGRGPMPDWPAGVRPHPHVLPIEGVASSGEQGACVLLAGGLRGRLMREHLEEEGALDGATTGAVLIAVASALASLHAQGVHGVSTSADVLFVPEPRTLAGTLLIPFHPWTGLPAPNETIFGGDRIDGRPELGLGDPPTAATDVYSAGLLALECVTGEAPAFDLERHRHAAPSAHALRALGPLAPVVEGCLRAHPKHRHAHAGALLRAARTAAAPAR